MDLYLFCTGVKPGHPLGGRNVDRVFENESYLINVDIIDF